MQEFIAQFVIFAPIIYLLLASILPIFLFPTSGYFLRLGVSFRFITGFIPSIISRGKLIY